MASVESSAVYLSFLTPIGPELFASISAERL